MTKSTNLTIIRDNGEASIITVSIKNRIIADTVIHVLETSGRFIEHNCLLANRINNENYHIARYEINGFNVSQVFNAGVGGRNLSDLTAADIEGLITNDNDLNRGFAQRPARAPLSQLSPPSTEDIAAMTNMIHLIDDLSTTEPSAGGGDMVSTVADAYGAGITVEVTPMSKVAIRTMIIESMLGKDKDGKVGMDVCTAVRERAGELVAMPGLSLISNLDSDSAMTAAASIYAGCLLVINGRGDTCSLLAAKYMATCIGTHTTRSKLIKIRTISTLDGNLENCLLDLDIPQVTELLTK